MAVRVRFPLRVQNQSEKQSESGVSTLIFLHSRSHTLLSLSFSNNRFLLLGLLGERTTLFEKRARTFNFTMKVPCRWAFYFLVNANRDYLRDPKGGVLSTKTPTLPRR